MDRWASFRILALATAAAATVRIVWFLMLGWETPHHWRDVCAMIGALLLIWIGTQRFRRRSELQVVGLLGALLLLVHELPFVGELLYGFLQTNRSVFELLAVVPMALSLLLCYFALMGMASQRAD